MSAGSGAFSRGGAFALIGVGVALFVALLYLLGAGEGFGGNRNNGQAHASATGLNGYAGLVRLVEQAGYDVTRSRSLPGLETRDLLVLTPTFYTDHEELAEILRRRAMRGPTLVIVPKWFAFPPGSSIPPEAREKFKRGWVTLVDAEVADWTDDLPAPFAFRHVKTEAAEGSAARWRGMGLSGRMPSRFTLHAAPGPGHAPLIGDSAGRVLAFAVTAPAGDAAGRTPQRVIFVADADLVNNYGLADPVRAAAAVALVKELAKDPDNGGAAGVTFDQTLNGFGASENLLTLAFRPPFLAATLCLLLALLIIGWRAFQRFGPPAVAAGTEIAFGKRQLIANGAGLIVHARRFALLASPYAALSARRIAERLGLARPDPEAIDAALARRLPLEEAFTRRAARLEAATGEADILTAAQALHDLNTKLSQGQ